MFERVALVIGNQEYGSNAIGLKGPTSDALRMTHLFEDLGFHLIKPKFNANFNDIRQSVREFGSVLAKGGIAAFFYSGHGLQGPRGGNYLMPVDARIHEPEDVERTCFAVSDIIESIVRKECTGLVFLDACRDAPFANLPEGEVPRAGWQSHVPTTLRNVHISYSTAPGNVAVDGDADEASPYTRALDKHLRTPDTPLGTLLNRVRKQVAQETGSRQVPWDEGVLLDDVILVPENRTVTTEPPRRERRFESIAREWSPQETVRLMIAATACLCLLVLVTGIVLAVILGKIDPAILDMVGPTTAMACVLALIWMVAQIIQKALQVREP